MRSLFLCIRFFAFSERFAVGVYFEIIAESSRISAWLTIGWLLLLVVVLDSIELDVDVELKRFLEFWPRLENKLKFKGNTKKMFKTYINAVIWINIFVQKYPFQVWSAKRWDWYLFKIFYIFWSYNIFLCKSKDLISSL